MQIVTSTLPNVGQPNQTVVPFAEALEKTKIGKFNYFLIVIGGLVMLSGVFETASIGFILPIMECDLQLKNQGKGVISTIGYIGIIVSSHLWGFWADTKGRRAVMVPTLLISFLITLLSSFSPYFWILLLLRFLNGFFIAGSTATIYAYIDEFHIGQTRSMALMASSVLFSIGLICLPILAWCINNQSWSLPLPFLGITYKPWRLFIVACGMPGLFCWIALLFYPESPKFLLSIKRDKEALEVLQKVHSWNVGRDKKLQIDMIIPEKDLIKESPSNSSSSLHVLLCRIREQTLPLFQSCYLRTTVIICTTQFWIFVTISGFYMWFPDILSTMLEFMDNNPGNNTLICDVINGKQSVTYKDDEVIHCTEKLHDRSYFYTLALEILSATGFAVIGIIAKNTSTVLILFVILVAFGACGLITVNLYDPTLALCTFTLLFPSGLGLQTLLGATTRLYPTHLKGMALCISLMFGRLGGVVGGNAAGFLLDYNCEATFYISGIALISCGFLGLLLPKQTNFKDNHVTKL